MVVAPVVALYIVHNADVVLLSRFAPRTRWVLPRGFSFGAVPSYFAGAFLMAWARLSEGCCFRPPTAMSGRIACAARSSPTTCWPV